MPGTNDRQDRPRRADLARPAAPAGPPEKPAAGRYLDHPAARVARPRTDRTARASRARADAGKRARGNVPAETRWGDEPVQAPGARPVVPARLRLPAARGRADPCPRASREPGVAARSPRPHHSRARASPRIEAEAFDPPIRGPTRISVGTAGRSRWGTGAAIARDPRPLVPRRAQPLGDAGQWPHTVLTNR